MSGNTGSIRAFIALSFPREIKAVLKNLQHQLRSAGVKAAWPKPEAMHLTLKFLGDINVSKLRSVHAGMEKAGKDISGFTLWASAIGVFPSPKNARVIWSGTSGQTDVLEKLAVRLDNILFEDLGVQKEKKLYRPHLTIARIKKPVAPRRVIELLQQYKDFKSDKFFISKMSCVKSKLTTSGAQHSILFSTAFDH